MTVQFSPASLSKGPALAPQPARAPAIDASHPEESTALSNNNAVWAASQGSPLLTPEVGRGLRAAMGQAVAGAGGVQGEPSRESGPHLPTRAIEYRANEARAIVLGDQRGSTTLFSQPGQPLTAEVSGYNAKDERITASLDLPDAGTTTLSTGTVVSWERKQNTTPVTENTPVPPDDVIFTIARTDGTRSKFTSDQGQKDGHVMTPGEHASFVQALIEDHSNGDDVHVDMRTATVDEKPQRGDSHNDLDTVAFRTSDGTGLNVRVEDNMVYTFHDGVRHTPLQPDWVDANGSMGGFRTVHVPTIGTTTIEWRYAPEDKSFELDEHPLEMRITTPSGETIELVTEDSTNMDETSLDITGHEMKLLLDALMRPAVDYPSTPVQMGGPARSAPAPSTAPMPPRESPAPPRR